MFCARLPSCENFAQVLGERTVPWVHLSLTVLAQALIRRCSCPPSRVLGFECTNTDQASVPRVALVPDRKSDRHLPLLSIGRFSAIVMSLWARTLRICGAAARVAGARTRLRRQRAKLPTRGGGGVRGSLQERSAVLHLNNKHDRANQSLLKIRLCQVRLTFD